MPDISDGTVFFEVDGSNTSATDPSWSEGMLPSKVNDSARALQGAIKRFWDRINPTLASAGTANVQTLTYTVAPSSYVIGEIYSFTVGSALTNTGATTLNINSLGAKSITINGVALIGGELNDGRPVSVKYDGTNFELIGTYPFTLAFTPADPTGTASGTYVMMGIGSTVAFTPRTSGNVEIYVVGDVANSGGSTTTYGLRYGTGTAPANGDADTGTSFGSAPAITHGAGNLTLPLALMGRASGLTVGTAYWADIAAHTGGAGTSSLAHLSVIVRECAI